MRRLRAARAARASRCSGSAAARLRSARAKSRVVEDREPDRLERRVGDRARARRSSWSQRDARLEVPGVARTSRRRRGSRAAGRCRRCGTAAAGPRSGRRRSAGSASRATLAPWRTSASWVSRQPFGLRGRARRVHQHRDVADRARAAAACAARPRGDARRRRRRTRRASRKPGALAARGRRAGAAAAPPASSSARGSCAASVREHLARAAPGSRRCRPGPARVSSTRMSAWAITWLELVRLEAAVDRHRDGAELGRAENAGDEVEAVRHQDPDLVAGPDAERRAATRAKRSVSAGELGVA